MEAERIRQHFTTFFAQKGHQSVAAAPLVNQEDPSLLFVNAGMNPFKTFFLGHQQAPYPRITSIQPCLRVAGKHNDLEEVGLDTYHHTLFEMLGNWSFGDYFKQEAIAWAWELLTDVYQLPKERLYVTIFGGDAQEGLAADEEAATIWQHYTTALSMHDKKDNFWEMGDTGPCGPCSEIHIDLRPEAARQQQCGQTLVNTGHPQIIEIWNLVFIQYQRLASGQLAPLAAKHVDTGMGLERLAMALQGKTATYDTDLFTPLLQALAQLAGKAYPVDTPATIALRVIADHLRAVTFAIAYGQAPSPTKAGYVVRRILRRAIRYGYSYLGLQEPCLHTVVAVLATQFEAVYPAIQAQQATIATVICQEEIAFLKTLKTGLQHLEQCTVSKKQIDGKTAFELYDTHGFPLDLTRLIAQEKGLTVDELGFSAALKAQQTRSQQAATEQGQAGDWQLVQPVALPSFIGYDQLTATVSISQYRIVTVHQQPIYQIVLNQTPFYPASGGQVGDTGYLVTPTERIAVRATQKLHGLVVHETQQLPQDVYGTLQAVVDAPRRQRITVHHSATHLLHAALRQVLGNHVVQKGSLVNDHMLRFDFAHTAKLDRATLEQLEAVVNQKIRDNVLREEQRNVPLQQALAMGATALFGEKYSEQVRVITLDPTFSVELCGGTHVAASGEIGFFKIQREGASAAGVRRIEAVAADAAERFVQEQQTVLGQIQTLLKQPKQIVQTVEHLLQERKVLQKEVLTHQAAQLQAVKAQLQAQIQTIQGITVIIATVKLPSTAALKQLAFQLKDQYTPIFVVLAADIQAKPQLVVLLSETLVTQWSQNAHDLIQQLAKPIDGAGGGQPDFALAGGKELAGLQHIATMAYTFFEQQQS